MPDNKKRTSEINVSTVAADTVVAGGGYLVTVCVGIITAVLIPKMLGKVYFGQWALFRGIVLLATTVTFLGGRQIMSRYYAPLMLSDPPAARRLFKVIALFRCGIALLAGCIGYVLLRYLAGVLFNVSSAWLLALAVFLRSQAVTGVVLLYGSSQIRRVTILNFLMMVTAPLTILAGFLLYGFSAVPAACLVGEAIVLLAAVGLVRPYLRYAPGWPERGSLAEIVTFAGHVAPASIGMGLFKDLPVCLAGAFGASVVQIGYIGLAVRMQGMASAGVTAINNAILPSLSVMTSEKRDDGGIEWIGLLCRAGMVAISALAGGFVIIGRPMISMIWGAAFIPALFPVALGLITLIPIWISSVYMNLAIVFLKPEIQLRSVGWLYLGTISVLFAFPALPVTERIMFALLAGCMMTSAYVIIALGRIGKHLPGIYRLWFVALASVFPFVSVKCGYDSVSSGVVWLLVFTASVLLSRSLRFRELPLLMGGVNAT